jgi:hypothetical protein
MRRHPPRCQARQGVARNRRPVRLAANQNEPDEDRWLSVGEAARMASLRWWLDE